MSPLEKVVLDLAKREVLGWKPTPFGLQSDEAIKIAVPDRYKGIKPTETE